MLMTPAYIISIESVANVSTASGMVGRPSMQLYKYHLFQAKYISFSNIIILIISISVFYRVR